MGWYGTDGATKADIIKEQTAERQYCLNSDGNDLTLNPNKRGVLLAHRCVGSHLWMVWSVQVRENENSEFVETDRYIELNLLQADNYNGRKGYSYKPMDESVHPYYYTCPLSYLDLVPDGSKHTNADWRKIVRDEAAKKAARPTYKEGDTLVFNPPLDTKQGIQITSVTCVNKKKHIFDVANYGRARMPVTMITKNEFTVQAAN